ncbi:relaxase/mobilization nuclease domain-containing protein [Streptomyces sp. BPTC-684]|uniref:relaxase/mobilization nuclease domain-containing protein n=1 Tax=Streptomyces sp. BPTC-684 TaxID=3043734 RepID=UPI0024B0CDAD|nr:relaxase/mobilization nuclease domain-containing protein [Streptomyces sp. BPTC-684]WHM38261.1 relaxase/mobilization nuclease domain-containing protein [Streptomyces sp. BPTC-684]
MIPKIILGKGPNAVRRTIGYLFGKGRANEHTDPHLVASWNGFAPDPGRSPHRSQKEVEGQLAAQLDQPVKMLGDKAPKFTVWHCPVRAAPEDPFLTDEQWADIARRIVAAAGIAPDGDEEACRWVAVRHADDHIHIAATLVRQDGRRPKRDYDQRAVQREARKIEIDYGLRRLKPGDGTAAKRPTSKEHFKAKRLGQDATSREILRLRVRRAVAAASSEAEFFAFLKATGVEVRPKTEPSGDVTGYSVALPGDTNKQGEPIWFAGSTLAGDLSLPKIRQRLTSTSPAPVVTPPGNPWHQATAATERIPHHLTHSDEHAAQGQLVALGAALDLLPLTAPTAIRAELERAAVTFERATRSRIAADHDSARVLRRSIQAIWRTPSPGGGGSGLAMLIDVALTAVAFARHWHRTRQHAQQEAAAEQALLHLQTAYAHIAGPVLDGLAHRAPTLQTKHRFAQHIRQAAPEYAERILQDSAWDALAAVLAEAEKAGHNAAIVLDQAVSQRPLDDARNPARALTWRIQRLGQRHAPSPRAQAAKARSTAQHPTAPVHTAAAAPPPQQPQARRR